MPTIDPVLLPLHLKPECELAPRVLLPGDPHRALLVAQDILERPRMFNHRRGLWGYTGMAADGEPLSVQATGMGGPSAAIVARELIGLGARTLLRIGTCGALSAELALGDLVAVTAAIAGDGASAALGASGPVAMDEDLARALAAAPAVAAAGVVVSTDLFYDERAGRAEGWAASGALAVEMEAAAIGTLAARYGAVGGCLLAVSDTGLLEPGTRRRLGGEGLEHAGLELGRTAWAAISA